MHHFLQDLSADYGLRGGRLRHGRGRIWFGPEDEQKSVGAEWLLVTKRISSSGASVKAENCGDDDWTLHAALKPAFSVWLHVDRVFPQVKFKDYGDRELGVSIHDGLISWRLWTDPMGPTRRGDWRDGMFNVATWMFGKFHMEEVSEETYRQVPIPMPEGAYMADIKVTKMLRSRERLRRWAQDQTMVSIDILDFPNGTRGFVPTTMNGKYGAGMDGIFSLTTQAKDVVDAVGKFVTSALRTRYRESRTLAWPPR